MGSIQRAFNFAVDRLDPSIIRAASCLCMPRLSGHSVQEGSAAEAALAIGFLALLKGDPLSKEITITGTLENDGTIGQVSQIAEKTTAAARGGYRILLVPRANFMPLASIEWRSIWNPMFGFEKSDTIEEAYEIMTGKKL